MKRLSFLIAFLFIFLYLLVPFANSTTYYVSWSSGNDSNDGKSPNSPWRSLNQASSGPNVGYQSGDVILFKKGDIWDITQASNKQVWVSLTVGLKISKSGTTWKSDPSFGSGSVPVFDAGGGNYTCIGIPTGNNITIDGFELRNYRASGGDWTNNGIFMDDVSSDSCTFQNLTIHNGYNGMYIKGSNHIIQNNTVYSIEHSGIYSFQGKNTYNHVRQNDVSYCSYNGIDIVGRSNHYWRIYRNYVHHCNNGIELSGSSYNDVWSNICAHNDTNPTDLLGGICLVQGSSNNKIYENTFYHNRFGIALQMNGGSPIQGNEIKNNIMSDNHVAEMILRDDVQRTNNAINTNVYYKSSSIVLICPEGTNRTTSWWSSNVDPNAIYTNPNFGNPSNLPDGLALVVPSTGITNGIYLGPNYQIDFYGATRTGEKWDLGAITSNTRDTTIPLPPVGLRIINN